MDSRLNELNTLFVETFDAILQVEEKNLKRVGNGNLSISEFHTLECIGKGEDCRRAVGEIAEALGVTVPTVTVCVGKLVKKGYVEKVRHEQDGRQVFVKLTKMGRKVNAGHLYFHENMVRNVSEGMSEEEKEVLLKGMKNLNRFFQRKLEPKEEA